MPLTLPLFIVFNILAGAYNLYALRGIMQHISTRAPRMHIWGRLLHITTSSTQVISGTSLVMYILGSVDISPQTLIPTAIFCFILTGTINFLSFFFITPLYVAHAAPRDKAHNIIVSAATLGTSLYSIFLFKLTMKMYDALHKYELTQIISPLPDSLSLLALVALILCLLTSVYFLHILLYLSTTTKGCARFFIHCLILGACINFFCFCFITLEIGLALLPENVFANAFFYGFDKMEGLVQLAIIFIIPIINMFFISILTPLYMHKKADSS